MSWADRVEQVLRLIDEVVHGRAAEPPVAASASPSAAGQTYAGATAGGPLPWSS